MAGSFHAIAPGRLEVREGGGGLSLFGLPFLATGVAVILISTGLVPVRTPSPFARPFLVLMGVVFAAIGGGLVFGRKWTTFNAADRTALVQYGLLVPMRDKTLHLDGYTSVRVDFERGDSDSADQFPVTLGGPGRSRLLLFSSTKYGESRARAIAIGGLLGLTIEDATTAHAVQVSPAEANLPLQIRARLQHDRDEIVARPDTMRSSVTDANGTVTIVIPGRRRTTVTASTAGIRIEQRRVWRARTVASLPADDIIDVDHSAPDTKAFAEEIQRRRPTMAAPSVGAGTEAVLRIVRWLVGSGGVTIKTRDGLTTFAQGLDDGEVRYLHYVVRRALSPKP